MIPAPPRPGLAAFAAAALLGACALAGEGDACRVDSDCAAGLLCTAAGTCRSEAAVAASLERDASVDVTRLDDTAAASDALSQDAAGCAPVAGVFEPATPPCRAPGTQLTVTGMVVLDTGPGLAQLASVANPVIADAYANGTLSMALWVDGELTPGCPHALAWVRSPADLREDCTPRYSDTMPFEIPNLVATEIERARLDPQTHVLTGLIDKAALLASMDEALRDVADQLIVLDVDTDGDDVPDRASAHLEILFAE